MTLLLAMTVSLMIFEVGSRSRQSSAQVHLSYRGSSTDSAIQTSKLRRTIHRHLVAPNGSQPLSWKHINVKRLMKTGKSSATGNATATRCAVCSGPPEICEMAYHEVTCQPPNNYCINKITNLNTGARLVDRRCGNLQTCYRDWYLASSDDDKCRQMSSSTIVTYQFECTFCCVTDHSNVDLHPKDSTLYNVVG